MFSKGKIWAYPRMIQYVIINQLVFLVYILYLSYLYKDMCYMSTCTCLRGTGLSSRKIFGKIWHQHWTLASQSLGDLKWLLLFFLGRSENPSHQLHKKPGSKMGVSKYRGKTPKMDGENNGKPYKKMMIWGMYPYFWKHPNEGLHLHLKTSSLRTKPNLHMRCFGLVNSWDSNRGIPRG